MSCKTCDASFSGVCPKHMTLDTLINALEANAEAQPLWNTTAQLWQEAATRLRNLEAKA